MMPMKRSLIFLPMLLLISRLSLSNTFSYPDDPTEIVVIGTVHISTENFNSDTLLHYFENIKPDLILVECDSSYMTSDFRLKEDIKYAFPETMAITEYLKNNSADLRPYDLTGRDNILNERDRIRNQRNILHDIEMLSRSGTMSNYGIDILNKILSMMNTAEELANSPSSYFNSEEGSRKIDTINYYTYVGLSDLVNAEPGLEHYRDFRESERSFWNKRNDEMLKNILMFEKAYEGKKIVVLCGFSHKNFLVKNLKENSGRENFIVKQYYDYPDN